MFFDYRRLLPNGNNVAARCLDESSNLHNEKRIHINAQVTAMITFLEMAGNISFVIILAITQKTSFMSLCHVTLVYHIILPYAFLMNTSHNKDRIVENGWKNVIKNIFGCFVEFVGAFKIPNLNIFRDTIVSEVKPGDQRDDTNDKEIFTVTKTYDDSKPSISRPFNTLNCPTETEVPPSSEIDLLKEFYSTQLFSHSETLKSKSYIKMYRELKK